MGHRRGWIMSFLNSDIEIVGFNGRPLVECGRALPIAHRISDGTHAVLDLTVGVDRLHWYSEEEATAFAAEHRWTKFRTSAGIPKCCMDDHGMLLAQPIVAYTNQSLLDNADRPLRPESWCNDYLMWKKLENFHDEYQATCSSSETIASLMNYWAEGLLNRFDAMARLGRDSEYLCRIADFALCVANDRTMRWSAYLRYTLKLQPEKAQRTFETMIKHEFPGVTWDNFIGGRRKLSDSIHSSLQTNATPSQTATVSSSGIATALPKVRGIAAAIAVPFEQLIKS